MFARAAGRGAAALRNAGARVAVGRPGTAELLAAPIRGLATVVGPKLPATIAPADGSVPALRAASAS